MSMPPRLGLAPGCADREPGVWRIRRRCSSERSGGVARGLFPGEVLDPFRGHLAKAAVRDFPELGRRDLHGAVIFVEDLFRFVLRGGGVCAVPYRLGCRAHPAPPSVPPGLWFPPLSRGAGSPSTPAPG